jgi:hypothetical protein
LILLAVKTLAEVIQPDGSTRWEMVELDEAAQAKPEPPAEDKPKRTRKATVEPASYEAPETTETPEF